MAEVIKMPLMSDTMEEGVVSKWHVKVGDQVKPGQLLADIETDKATNEFESFWSGTLLHIGVEEGKAVPVGAVLAVIGEKGEDFKAALEAAQAGAPERKAAVAEAAAAKQPEVVTTTEVKQPEVPSVTTGHETDGNGRMKISPLARKMAKERGIDPRMITGTGDDGRIVRRDIEAFAGGGKFTPAFVGKESFEEVDVSQMRKTIAKRLVQSKFSAPHFYLTMEISMDRAAEARESLGDATGVKISVNDMIIKAAALALRRHPAVNASWIEATEKAPTRIRYARHIHIGMAVAMDEGLIVPVIKFADGKSIQQIAVESRQLAEKARNKQLQPEEYSGNTFSVSNLGMMDIEEFTAIINPPDACILAVGRVKETPVVRNGQIVVGKVMKVTLSCDHRVVDGATGSRFLQTFKQLLEEPVRMFV